MSRARAAFVQPAFRGYGGLESYSLALLKVLAELAPVDLVTAVPVERERVLRAFGAGFPEVNLVTDERAEPLPDPSRSADRRTRLRAEAEFAALTGEYDLVISPSISLPWRNGARRGVLISHFPCVRDHKLPEKGLSPWWTGTGRLEREVARRVNSWHRVLTSSHFAAGWLREYWRREAVVVHPAVTPGSADAADKRRWILGAGFFTPPAGDAAEPWSYKRHEVLIDAFKQAHAHGLDDWELHLAGHAQETPEVEQWLAALRKRAEGYPVYLHPNCSREELASLFRQSALFWHAVGYGVDPRQRPERMEHFGIVTAEALSYGCVPVVINRGGQPEIVDRDSGVLWETVDELVEQTLALAREPVRRAALARGAVLRAENFSPEVFREGARKLLMEELAA